MSGSGQYLYWAVCFYTSLADVQCPVVWMNGGRSGVCTLFCTLGMSCGGGFCTPDSRRQSENYFTSFSFSVCFIVELSALQMNFTSMYASVNSNAARMRNSNDEPVRTSPLIRNLLNGWSSMIPSFVVISMRMCDAYPMMMESA